MWWISGKFGALCPQARIPRHKDLGQTFIAYHPNLQFKFNESVALWRVNSDTVSILYSGASLSST